MYEFWSKELPPLRLDHSYVKSHDELWTKIDISEQSEDKTTISDVIEHKHIIFIHLYIYFSVSCLLKS